MMTDRRNFLAGIAGGTLVTALGTPAASSGIDPIVRQGPASLKLSIAAYSYRDQLQNKKKPSMTMEGFIDLASEMGCAAVELTSYYIKDTSRKYLASLKARCVRLGLDVSGGSVGNNFTEAKTLKDEIRKTKEWTERYSLLGAKTMRIFAGNLPKGDTEEAARKRCIEAIQEVCDHAAEHGVYMALENHGGIVTTPEQLLSIVKEVKHDWFGVNLDSGNFRVEDPYAAFEQLVPYSVTVQFKTEISKGPKGPKQHADLAKFVQILKKANYRGYVALEYEEAADPMVTIPKYIETLKKLM